MIWLSLSGFYIGKIFIGIFLRYYSKLFFRMEQIHHQFTTIIEREGDVSVALCPELDIASQGDTVEEAKSNLAEAIELFLEVADPSEIQNRLPRSLFEA